MPVPHKVYRFVGQAKRLGDRYLVVTKFGAYTDLSSSEYYALKTHTLNDALYSSLEERLIIITDKNEQAITDAYREKKRFLFKGTSLHIVIPTLRCNQKCTYCHAGSVPEYAEGFDMDKETATKVVDFIFQSPSTGMTIEFQGGEPLLNPSIVKHIVTYALKLNKEHKKELKITIVTNLTLMTDQMLDFLLEHKVNICTSLDGTEKIHDQNRKFLNGSGSYAEVVAWIRKFNDKVKAKKNPPRINALLTTTKYTLGHAREVVDEYERLGLFKIWFRWLDYLGFAKDRWKELTYTPDEFITFWKEGVDYIYSKKADLEEGSVRILAGKILGSDYDFLDIRSPCGAAIGQLAYMHNGDIFSCDEGRMLGDDFFKLGSVLTDNYKQVLSTPKTCSLVASSVNETFLCDACIYQPYCGVCPVLNFMYSGNIVPKLALDTRCKILKAQFDYVFEKLVTDEKFKARILRVMERERRLPNAKEN